MGYFRMRSPGRNPITASPLSSKWLEIRGKDQWLPATAAVFSCDWTTRDNFDSEVGHYHVIYSYSVNGNRYTGEFIDFGLENEEYFRRDDTFEIRYNPRDPSQSYYPELRTQNSFLFICAVIGAGLAIMVMVVAVLAKYLAK